jgi:hypothetical protein
MSYEDILKSALENAVKRERTARRRSIIFTLIPMVMAVVLISVTWWQVGLAQKQALAAEGAAKAAESAKATAIYEENQAFRHTENFKVTAQAYQNDITQLQIQLDSLATQIPLLKAQATVMQEENNLLKSVAQVQYKGANLLDVLKEMSSIQGKRGELFNFMLLKLDEGSISWKANGIGPDNFDSPGFAVVVLTDLRLIQGDPVQNHYNLKNILKSVDKPEIGDVIFYESGYTMFYFEYRGQPLVVGMTPLGLAALNYEFASTVMVGHVNYPY